MHIDIYSDPICPWCFIGKRRLERALAERPGLEVTVRWRAFQLNPDMAPDGMDRGAYLAAKFGGADRAAQVYQYVLAAARKEGLAIDLAAIRRTPNTLDAHRLIRFAGPGAVQDKVVEGLFRGYFLDGRDIGDREVLVAVAADAGLDGPAVSAFLDGDQEAAAVQAEDRRARMLGITGVPCFIFDDKYALTGAQEPAAFLPLFDLEQAAAARPSNGDTDLAAGSGHT